MFLTLEIFERSRDAIARQIGGTGSVDHAQQAQCAGNQRLVPYGSKPQYTVEPLLNQIDLPIRTRHLQLQLGMSRHEIRQGRHDRCARHLGRKINPPSRQLKPNYKIRLSESLTRSVERELPAVARRGYLVHGLHSKRSRKCDRRALAKNFTKVL